MTFRHEAILVATLARWRSEPFAWHAGDCMSSCLLYASTVTGADCMAPWRGLYLDEATAMDLIAMSGGLMAMIDKSLCMAGAKRVQMAERGDVICARFGEHDVGGICTGGAAEFRMERGSIEITTRHLDIRAAWRLA